MGIRYTASLVIALGLSAVALGTHPATTARGLAASPPRERAISHGPGSQAPEFTSPPLRIGTASVYTETESQTEMVTWVLQATASAGLKLPAVEIHIHENRRDCSPAGDRPLNGYHAEIDGYHIVHSCGNRWTLLHELGHVWDDHSLDTATRQRLLDHQGLDSWHDEDWSRSGAEHLASIIAWGLDGAHPTRIGHYDRDHLGEAYLLTTGNRAPALGGDPVSTRSGLTIEQDALIDHAVSLFEAAGLELPGIDFVGADNRDECFGRSGAAIGNGLRTEVRLCLSGTGPTDDWVALHEIAHAWDHGKLDEETRQDFLELRGLTAWREGDWQDRGAEQSAEILVWGLIDRPVVPARIASNSCDELLTGYRALTGSDPLHGYTDRCDK